jgi:hypothetical protein
MKDEEGIGAVVCVVYIGGLIDGEDDDEEGIGWILVRAGGSD